LIIILTIQSLSKAEDTYIRIETLDNFASFVYRFSMPLEHMIGVSMPSRKARKRKLKNTESDELSGNRLPRKLLNVLVNDDILEPLLSLPSINLTIGYRRKEIADLMFAVTFRAIFQGLKLKANSDQLSNLRNRIYRIGNETDDIELAQLEVIEQHLIKLIAGKKLSAPLEIRLHNALGFFIQNLTNRLHRAVTQLLNESLCDSVGGYMSLVDLERSMGFKRIIDIYRFKGRPKGRGNFTKSKFEKELDTALHKVRSQGQKLTQENVASAFNTKMDTRQLRRYLNQFGKHWHDIKHAN
jgi:hypothetical protein